LKLKLATVELEKQGGSAAIEKPKDGGETTTVYLLKTWTGDKDVVQLLKSFPNVQMIYIDNGQVSDATLAPFKELPSVSSLTVMSPQLTDAALDHVKALPNLTMLFLT